MARTLKAGVLAYLNTLAGLVPCKVLAIYGRNGYASTAQVAHVRVTAYRPGFARGEEFERYALDVVPRDAIYHRCGVAMIRPYTVECHTTAR